MKFKIHTWLSELLDKLNEYCSGCLDAEKAAAKLKVGKPNKYFYNLSIVQMLGFV